MKNIVYYILLLVGFISGYLTNKYILNSKSDNISKNIIQILEKPLEKYEIEKLSATDIKPGKLTVKEIIKEENKYTSYLFEYEFNPNLDGKTIKKTTGQLNLPKETTKFRISESSELSMPVILMFRGYVQQEVYRTGDGTRNAAAIFAEKGFVTIAPDFLGYAGSDDEAENIFESRFQTHVTALSLLKTLAQTKNFNEIFSPNYYTTILPNNYISIFLWGHSNGGQIALTLLQESGSDHPTVLWAPVTKPFPYSILYYSDDTEDHGKFLRKKLAEFESLYDVEKFSLTNYLDKIKSPVLLQQGTSDDAVPFIWSENLVNELKLKGVDVTFIKYPGADHNMRPVWNQAVEKDLDFYQNYHKHKDTKQ